MAGAYASQGSHCAPIVPWRVSAGQKTRNWRFRPQLPGSTGHNEVQEMTTDGPHPTLSRSATIFFVTSFLVVWQPSPPPPPLWVRFLREAPFGTQLVRAQDLHWDGKYLSIELLDEKDIEAYVSQMVQWVEYANSELAHCPMSPAALALKAAQKRAEAIENRLRR